MTDIDNWDERDITNNNSKSGPVIITAECKVSSRGSKLQCYNPLIGKVVNDTFKVTIHNYESEALGYDPTVKSYQNYYHFLHLSTLLHMPWGMSVKFRDMEGDKTVFGAYDIVRMLEERTEKVMEEWGKRQVEFKKLQDETAKRVDIEYGVVETVMFDKKKAAVKKKVKTVKKDDEAMLI